MNLTNPEGIKSVEIQVFRVSTRACGLRKLWILASKYLNFTDSSQVYRTWIGKSIQNDWLIDSSFLSQVIHYFFEVFIDGTVRCKKFWTSPRWLSLRTRSEWNSQPKIIHIQQPLQLGWTILYDQHTLRWGWNLYQLMTVFGRNMSSSMDSVSWS